MVSEVNGSLPEMPGFLYHFVQFYLWRGLCDAAADYDFSGAMRWSQGCSCQAFRNSGAAGGGQVLHPQGLSAAIYF